MNCRNNHFSKRSALMLSSFYSKPSEYVVPLPLDLFTILYHSPYMKLQSVSSSNYNHTVHTIEFSLLRRLVVKSGFHLNDTLLHKILTLSSLSFNIWPQFPAGAPNTLFPFTQPQSLDTSHRSACFRIAFHENLTFSAHNVTSLTFPSYSTSVPSKPTEYVVSFPKS